MDRDSFELMSPDGSRIVGTLEHLQGTALADTFYEEDGKVLPNYVGDTEVHWNGQEGVDFEGEPVLIDEDGMTWLARECQRVMLDVEDANHEWTVIMLCDDSSGQRQMYMDTARAPNAASAVEIVRDQAVKSGNGWEKSDIHDIITIPGKHTALGPSQPWW